MHDRREFEGPALYAIKIWSNIYACKVRSEDDLRAFEDWALRVFREKVKREMRNGKDDTHEDDSDDGALENNQEALSPERGKFNAIL